MISKTENICDSKQIIDSLLKKEQGYLSEIKLLRNESEITFLNSPSPDMERGPGGEVNGQVIQNVCQTIRFLLFLLKTSLSSCTVTPYISPVLISIAHILNLLKCRIILTQLDTRSGNLGSS